MATHNTHTHEERKPDDAAAHLSQAHPSAHSRAGMAGRDVKILLNKILRSHRWSQEKLARELDVTQPTISRLLAGAEAKWETRTKILALARRLTVINNSTSDSLQNAEGVPLVATVGTGGELHMLTEGEQELVPAPPGEGILATMVAAKVIGSGMMPMLDDGWTIYWDQAAGTLSDDLVGKLCVVCLIGGQILVRRLYRSRKNGRYDLHAVNAPALLEQALDWAARVCWILPT